MSKLLCKVLKCLGTGYATCPSPPIARLLCLIPLWRAFIISCCQLQLEWTEPGWYNWASAFSQLYILKRHCFFCKLSQNRMFSRRNNKAFYNYCMNSKFWVFGSVVFRFCSVSDKFFNRWRPPPLALIWKINPWNLAFSALCLVSFFEAFWKCCAKAGKECFTASGVRRKFPRGDKFSSQSCDVTNQL